MTITAERPTTRRSRGSGPLVRYSATFLACRDVGHTWQLEDDFHRSPAGFIERTLACATCTTQRRDLWYASGVRYRNAYRYPDDYRIPGGMAPLDIRKEVLRRSRVLGRVRL